MADTVQVLMERMIPELEDLQEKKLFSADEIHQIVERRREFEYMMRRVPLRKIDGLRYIEYELNLEALRKKRKARLGLIKMSLSDTSGIKRVHATFDRLLYKHRGNVDLWLQYIEFCKTEGSGRVLSHVFTRALQSHPRSAELWIEAAAFEFSVNLSVDSARVLMQRAIRINQHNHRLWHEYFRLELLYIQKLAVRREILKLDDTTTATEAEGGDASENGVSVLLEELPEEQDQEGQEQPQLDQETAEMMEAAAEKKRSRDMILSGAIPRIIYKNAIAAIPQDVAFRLQFIELSDLFARHRSNSFASKLSQFILDSCVEDFPTSELVHAVQALRPFVSGSDDGDQEEEAVEKQCVSLFEQSVVQLPTTTMKEKFAEWLMDRLATAPHTKTSFLVTYAKKTLKQYVDEAVSVEIAIKYVDLVHRSEGPSSAVAVAHDLVAKQTEYSTCAPLWLLYSQLIVQPHNHEDHEKRAVKRRRSSDNKHISTTTMAKNAPLVEALAVLKDALKHLRKDDASGNYLVYVRLLEVLVSDAATSVNVVDATFQDALKTQQVGSDLWSALREKYFVWASATRAVEVVRVLYKKFLDGGQLLPCEATYSFLLRCIDFESALGASELNMDRVRSLFERLVDLFGNQNQQVWVAYIEFFKTHAQFAEANKVLHRALRVWKDSPELMQLSA